MRVICEKTCVTWIDGVPFSMTRGKSYDIPKEKANTLVRSGSVRFAQAPPKKTQAPEPQVEPEPQAEVEREPELTPQVQTEDEPMPVKKRPSRTKRLDGSPENK